MIGWTLQHMQKFNLVSRILKFFGIDESTAIVLAILGALGCQIAATQTGSGKASWLGVAAIALVLWAAFTAFTGMNFKGLTNVTAAVAIGGYVAFDGNLTAIERDLLGVTTLALVIATAFVLVYSNQARAQFLELHDAVQQAVWRAEAVLQSGGKMLFWDTLTLKLGEAKTDAGAFFVGSFKLIAGSACLGALRWVFGGKPVFMERVEATS